MNGAVSNQSWSDALTMQWRVIVAVMLRNIRTRFFGHGFGYLIAIAWPIVHILMVVLVFSAFGRGLAFGESALLFVATGTVPFMTVSYLSRFMLQSLSMSRPLLAFSQVKIIDVLFASALLEILTSCVVVLVMVALAWAFDIPFWPSDIVQAVCAYGSAVLLGVGFGLLNGVIMYAAPLWFTIYMLITILLWMMSGVTFMPSAIPEPARSWLAYNPILHSIEWMRCAFYESYTSTVLDKTYVLVFGCASILLGLALERGMRGFLLVSK